MHSIRTQFISFIAALLLVLLLLLNTYPLISSRDAVFEEKRSSMTGQAATVASSLAGLEKLSRENIAEVLRFLDMSGYSRVVVIDQDGKVIYASDNSAEEESETEDLRTCLEGKTVFRSNFTEKAFVSSLAMPLYSQGNLSGAIYMTEYDTERAEIILSFQKQIRAASLGIGALALLLALVFAFFLLRRIRALVRSMRVVADGDYSYRHVSRGRDEITELGEEFNQLTERLQTTEQQRRRFVSDASHELKTPLAAITLLADSIVQTDGMPMPTVREFVYDIGREAERLRRVTQRLLELSRLHNGSVSLPEQVDLRKVSEEALKMLRPLAEERRVKLESSLDEGCLVLADQDDLHQVIFNLAENAIKYNVPEGQVRVLLYRQEGEARLLVDDTGIGIPEEKLPHIFDRFYRVDESRTGGDEGSSGLGLSIVKETVEKHGGRVEAQRREGGGMRFSVSFPLLVQEKVRERK